MGEFNLCSMEVGWMIVDGTKSTAAVAQISIPRPSVCILDISSLDSAKFFKIYASSFSYKILMHPAQNPGNSHSNFVKPFPSVRQPPK